MLNMVLQVIKVYYTYGRIYNQIQKKDKKMSSGTLIRHSKSTLKAIHFLHLLCVLSCCLLCCTIFSGCGQPTVKESATGFYFNTIISVTVYETHSKEDTLNASALAQNCMDLAASYEQLFSRTIEGSDIWNINHSNGSPVTVSDDSVALLSTALFYSELSEGLVDPTIGSLSALWNFSDKAKTVPSDSDIKEALSHVDFHSIVIAGNQVTLTDPDADIDLGFIAKGYIADQMKDYLISEGVTSAIINLGGNVLTIGNKPDGSEYTIGVQKPFAETGTALLTLSVSDKSVVSSGNYERYFYANDTLYHHILSTEDGYPANSDLSQVTIISDSSVDGDALSTLCFILGYEDGHALIESLPDIEAVFVTANGDIYKTYA